MLRSRKSQPVNAKGAIAVALGAALVVTALVTPAHADDEDRLNAGVGYPEWSGAEQPVPDLPADFTPGNQLQAIMDADLRSEERRVGKEGRARGGQDRYKREEDVAECGKS